jgi:hypothetical protein
MVKIPAINRFSPTYHFLAFLVIFAISVFAISGFPRCIIFGIFLCDFCNFCCKKMHPKIMRFLHFFVNFRCIFCIFYVFNNEYFWCAFFFDLLWFCFIFCVHFLHFLLPPIVEVDISDIAIISGITNMVGSL